MTYSTLHPPTRRAVKKNRRNIKMLVACGIFCLIGVAWWRWGLTADTSSDNPDAASSSATDNKEGSATSQFDKTQHSTSDPSSLWVVVNKQRPLSPVDYTPTNLTTADVNHKYARGSMKSLLRTEAAQAVEELFKAAQDNGTPLLFVSGYRSYANQEDLFNSYVSSMGQTAAEQISARAGHSEHQTGWAVDVGSTTGQCEVETCFADMPEGKWLAANAHRFGFIIRYEKNQTSITGYDYEPWHLRYVGKDLAAELKRTNTHTLEQFFELPAAPTYD